MHWCVYLLSLPQCITSHSQQDIDELDLAQWDLEKAADAIRVLEAMEDLSPEEKSLTSRLDTEYMILRTALESSHRIRGSTTLIC